MPVKNSNGKSTSGRPMRGTGSVGPKRPDNPSGRSQYLTGGKRSK